MYVVNLYNFFQVKWILFWRNCNGFWFFWIPLESY